MSPMLAATKPCVVPFKDTLASSRGQLVQRGQSTTHVMKSSSSSGESLKVSPPSVSRDVKKHLSANSFAIDLPQNAAEFLGKHSLSSSMSILGQSPPSPMSILEHSPPSELFHSQSPPSTETFHRHSPPSTDSLIHLRSRRDGKSTTSSTLPSFVHGSVISMSPIREEEETDSGEALLVSEKLQSVLQRGVERYLTCDSVIVPRHTLLRAANDILRLSADRPHGLRGSLVELFLNYGTSCKRIAQVVADPRVEHKTVIKLTLHRADPSDDTTLHLRSGYTMERCCMP